VGSAPGPGSLGGFLPEGSLTASIRLLLIFLVKADHSAAVILEPSPTP